MKMKLLLGAVLAALATSALFTAAAVAAPATYSSYSTGATNAGALAHAIIGANSANAGTPVVTSIDATSDKAASLVQFYRVTAETAANYTNSTTRLDVVLTNGIGVSGTIVIRHLLTDTYEKRTLANNTGSTNLVVTVAPLEAVVPGDIIYKVATTGVGALSLKTNSFSVASAGMSCQLNGPRLFAGQKGKPLLLEVDATTTGTINSVTATFE